MKFTQASKVCCILCNDEQFAKSTDGTYICTRCGARYSVIEVGSIHHVSNYLFVEAQLELIENKGE